MHHPLLSLLLLQSLLLCLATPFTYTPSHPPPHLTNASDQHSLLQFKASIKYDPQNALSDWNPSSGTFCNWTGVVCSSTKQRVVVLNLTGRRLQGPLSPFLGNLTFLHELLLANNSFYGSVPKELGFLRRLRGLSLSYNPLGGSIPSRLGQLAELQFLSLGANHMTGAIPSSLANISSLTDLELGTNNLSGAIPSEFGTLTRLKELRIIECLVSGGIPSSLANISTLISLFLHSNYIAGAIPPQFGLLTNLEVLLLYQNHLGGPIPASLSNCTSLQILSLDRNHLTGRIPPELGHKLANLQGLYLWGNRLNGSIPGTLANCSQLTLLELAKNQLSGTVPIELDDDMTAHISDFGLARLISPSSENSLTSIQALRGSIGYIAPEYGLGGRVSTKGDVYSYGILLLEMLTRKRPNSDMFVGELDLRKWVSVAFPDRLAEVVDDSLLRGAMDAETEQQNMYKCVSEVVHVGLVCTNQSPEERPSMREVVAVLEGIKATFVGTPVVTLRLPADIPSLLQGRNNGGAFGSESSSSW